MLVASGRPGPARTLRTATRRVLSVLSARPVALGLLLVAAGLTLIGTLVDQVPTEALGDPVAETEWVAAQRRRYGGATNLLARLGFFHVFGSLWFLVTMGLIAVSILAATLVRLPEVFARVRHPVVRQREAFFVGAPVRAAGASRRPSAETAELVKAALARGRFRVREEMDSGGGVHLYADRHPVVAFASSLAHLAFVLIIVGVAVTSSGGFREQRLEIPIGSEAAVGQGTGLTVRAEEFSASAYADGSPKAFESLLSVVRDGVAVTGGWTRVNAPLRWDGYSLYQSSFGNAAEILVTDIEGKALLRQAVPLQWTSADGALTFGKVRVPGRDREVFVATPASGRPDPLLPSGLVRVDLMAPGSDEPRGSAILGPQDSRTFEALTVTFLREHQYTGITVTRDPGALWVWAGAGLLLLSLFGALVLRHDRVWARVDPDGDGSRIVLARSDRSSAPWFDTLSAAVGAQRLTHPTEKGSHPS